MSSLESLTALLQGGVCCSNVGVRMDYDLIVVGGGMAGSTLARRMALSGARVLVLERETQFRDRVRGESLQPWGVAEARQFGISELLQPFSAGFAWFWQVVDGQPTT